MGNGYGRKRRGWTSERWGVGGGRSTKGATRSAVVGGVGKTRHNGMVDLKKNLFNLKNIKIQTQIAKNNKSNYRSIPLVAQITLRKSSTDWPSLLSSSY